MKVGLVTERIGAALGGAERWTFDFARWLVVHGHDVHVVCRVDSRSHLPPGAVRHEVRCSRSPLAFAGAASERLARLGCDVTHDMGCGWNCDVFQPHCGSRTAAVVRNLQRLPPALHSAARTVQRWLPRYRRFAALCDRQYVRSGRIFVAVSQMAARDFERWHGIDSERIRVVYNGVDTERFAPANRDPLRTQARESLGFAAEDVVLLLVAHNPRLKGLPTLIRSANELRRQGAPVRLLIVGGGPTARDARRCRRIGLPAHFTGMVSDPLPYYAAADVYVHPTFYDPCSLVVLEAWACGLPVITSRFNGCAELMRDELDNFVLPDPADSHDLSRRIGQLLDSDDRSRVGRLSRRLAEAHGADDCFSRITDIYQEIDSGRRAAA